MGKLTSDVFPESCCDGGAASANAQSAQPCGCDPAASWVCETHRAKKTENYPTIEELERAERRQRILQEIERPTNTPNVEAEMRKVYPHGHPRFLPITLREIQLHNDKNHDYAKGGEPLGNFTRVAAILALYPNLRLDDCRVVALVYAMKQLDAVLWGLSAGIQHKVEGLIDRLRDISIYAKLVICMTEDREKKDSL